MLVRRALFALALGACTAFVHPAAALAKGLDYEDLRKIVSIDAPAISPDGTRVVYVRSTIDWKNNRRDTELVLVDVRTGNARTITHDRIDVAAPQWSPDGTQLAYLASPERDKPRQTDAAVRPSDERRRLVEGNRRVQRRDHVQLASR